MEAHLRRADLGARWRQLLLRPAVNFQLNNQVMFTQGYSYYITYPYGEFPSNSRTGNINSTNRCNSRNRWVVSRCSTGSGWKIGSSQK